MKKRNGDWAQLYSGKKFWPLDPKAEEIQISDIAHALSLSTRFNGHCEKFYSVAQHSVLVSLIVKKDQALGALLHDATEAYIGDVIRPLKKHLPQIQEIEKKIEKEIHKKFGIKNYNEKEIKKADMILLFTEARDLMKSPPDRWENAGQYKPLDRKIIPWNPEKAERLFMRRFREIIGQQLF